MPAETLSSLASRLASQLTRSKRDNGETFVHVKDGAPDKELLSDLIFCAHGSGEMFPEDIRYGMTEQALDTLAELPNDADEDDARDALAAVEPPIYTHELTEWLHSRADRMGYCDDAREEWGGDVKDAYALLSLGWLMEFREVADAVLGFLLEHLESLEDDDAA